MNAARLTLLLSSAGRRVELMNCFRSDADRLGIELTIIAVDHEPATSPACHLADRAYPVAPCTSPRFIDDLSRICREQGVDLVVPTIDPELSVLSAAAPALAQQGTCVVISTPEVIALTRDKLRCAELLTAQGLPAPWTVDLGAGSMPLERFRPSILKPRYGSASRGLIRVEDPAAWPRHALPDAYIAQELLRGTEYTVNVFFDRTGALRAAVPHRRLEVRAGEVAKGLTERHRTLCDMAARLASLVPGARGPLCFQAIVQTDGATAIFEINARFGGGFPLAHHAGARFSQWLLEEALGWPCTAHDDWQEGVMMLRYDQSVFLSDPEP